MNELRSLNDIGVPASTIAFFGDSIANGLGVGKDAYMNLVSEAIGFELLDYSNSAKQVSHSLNDVGAGWSPPGICVVAHGITEAVVRPRSELLRYMPPRWRRTGWMDPRPYYSSRMLKRIPQRVESSVRWRVKNILIAIGRSQLADISSFESDMRDLLNRLGDAGSVVITLGSPSIRSKYFPGSEDEFRSYEAVVEAMSVRHVPIADELLKWSDYLDDGFHPNRRGHRAIAEVLLKGMQNLR